MFQTSNKFIPKETSEVEQTQRKQMDRDNKEERSM